MNLFGNFLIKTLYRHNVSIDMRMKRASNALTSLGAEERGPDTPELARPHTLISSMAQDICPGA